MKLHLDFETRSKADLRKIGVYAYAEHRTTEVLCASYGIDEGPIRTWFPWRSGIPDDLQTALSDPKCAIGAHNAAFERLMLQHVMGIPIPVERFDCTAARAARFGLPRSLGGAAAATGMKTEKDREGHKLMLRMCKPQKRRTKAQKGEEFWIDDDESLDRLGAYCEVDVAVEKGLDALLPPLGAEELETWLATEEMNDRGVLLDDDLLLQMTFFIDAARSDLLSVLAAMTGTRWPSLHHAYVTQWLKAQGWDDFAEDGVGKAAVVAMLERDDVPPLLREVLTMRQIGSGTASTKFAAMLDRMSTDHRLRGSMVYCGAPSTGRWSSRGVQLQNLLRMKLLTKSARLAACIRDIHAGCTPSEVADIHGPPIVLAGELLRPTIIATPGYWLARGDSKQIEARVLPWLAGAEWKLDAFRRYDAGTGPDLYKIGAAGIYRIPVGDIADEDPRRQIGKVAELSLGFQGGAGALQAMCRGYGVKIPRYAGPNDVPATEGTDAWIKEQWRAANPEIKAFWYALEQGAIDCMRAPPGAEFPVGRVTFRRNAQALVMRLPSGRTLVYWTPSLRPKPTPWGEVRAAVVYRAEDPMTSQWREFTAYGGLWTNNATQGSARDCMAYWVRRMRQERLNPVLLVHDEGVNEADCARFPTAESARDAVSAIMCELPPGFDGLPVNADASAGLRYVKG